MAKSDTTLTDVAKDVSKVNEKMKKDLKERGMEDLHAYFLITSFILSLSFGMLCAFLFNATGFGFAIFTIAFTIFGGLISFNLMRSIIMPLYCTIYSDKSILKTLLSYQVLVLFVGIVLSIIFWSLYPIGGSLLVFSILAFIYPISKNLYGEQKSIEDFKTMLNKIYSILIVLQGIVTIVLKFAGLF